MMCVGSVTKVIWLTDSEWYSALREEVKAQSLSCAFLFWVCKLTCETDLVDQTSVYFLSSHSEQLIGRWVGIWGWRGSYFSSRGPELGSQAFVSFGGLTTTCNPSSRKFYALLKEWFLFVFIQLIPRSWLSSALFVGHILLFVCQMCEC